VSETISIRNNEERPEEVRNLRGATEIAPGAQLTISWMEIIVPLMSVLGWLLLFYLEPKSIKFSIGMIIAISPILCLQRHVPESIGQEHYQQPQKQNLKRAPETRCGAKLSKSLILGIVLLTLIAHAHGKFGGSPMASIAIIGGAHVSKQKNTPSCVELEGPVVLYTAKAKCLGILLKIGEKQLAQDRPFFIQSIKIAPGYVVTVKPAPTWSSSLFGYSYDNEVYVGPIEKFIMYFADNITVTAIDT